MLLLLPLLIRINGYDLRNRTPRETPDTRGVDLRLTRSRRGDYEAEELGGSLRVSRAHRSMMLHRQTDERPSLPTGLGNSGPLARTLTR